MNTTNTNYYNLLDWNYQVKTKNDLLSQSIGYIVADYFWTIISNQHGKKTIHQFLQTARERNLTNSNELIELLSKLTEENISKKIENMSLANIKVWLNSQLEGVRSDNL
jgi:hypothetical protein